MREPSYEVVERERVFMHRRAVIETSVITADLLVTLAKATKLSLDQVLEHAVLLFAEQGRIAESLVDWGESMACVDPKYRPASSRCEHGAPACDECVAHDTEVALASRRV